MELNKSSGRGAKSGEKCFVQRAHLYFDQTPGVVCPLLLRQIVLQYFALELKVAQVPRLGELVGTVFEEIAAFCHMRPFRLGLPLLKVLVQAGSHSHR